MSSTELKIDFVKDLKNIILDSFKNIGYQFNRNAPVDQIVRGYFNALRREISLRPRKVRISKEIDIYSLPKNIKQALDDIIVIASMGNNLNPYLSDNILNPSYKDRLLYDWRIHHLHLGNTRHAKDPRFIQRTKELLYAFVEENDCYCVNISDHDEDDGFANTALIEIIKNNWPHLLDKYKLVGVKPGNKFENKQVKELRNAGISIMSTTSDGSVYASLGGGYATDGSSTLNTMHSDMLMRKLFDMEKLIKDNEAVVREKIAETVQRCPRTINIKLKSWDELSVVAFETKAKIELRFPWGRSGKTN